MHKLHDDIILQILNYLPLCDQFNLSDAFPSINDLIKGNWKLQFKRSLIINFTDNTLNPEQLKEVLQQVHDTVEVIELKYINLEIYQTLCSFLFPRTIDFSFIQRHQFEICDEDLLKLKNIFPNLLAFSPHGKLTGKYIDSLWCNLQILSLRYCCLLKNEQLCHILDKLPLKSLDIVLTLPQPFLHGRSMERFCALERIILDYDQLSWFVESDMLRQMNYLREITVAEIPDMEGMVALIENVCRHKRLKLLEEHIILESNLKVHAQFSEFKKLSRFSLCNSIKNKYYSYPKETNLILRKMAKIQFNCLQHIILYNVIFFEEADLVHILKHGTNLTLLSVEYCRTTFKEFALNKNLTFACRKFPLTLNWYKNSFEPKLLESGYLWNPQITHMVKYYSTIIYNKH